MAQFDVSKEFRGSTGDRNFKRTFCINPNLSLYSPSGQSHVMCADWHAAAPFLRKTSAAHPAHPAVFARDASNGR